MKELVVKDYKDFGELVKGGMVFVDDSTFQYSVEYRQGVLHIVELNFKPNTKSTMSVPVPVYNEFVKQLSEKIGIDGVRGNEVMGLFIQLYEQYRRVYLGAMAPLKPSSYVRYASVLYLLWYATDGKLGFKCSLKPKQIIKTVTQDGVNLVINNEIQSKGYYIEPTKYPAVTLYDRRQQDLLKWQK